MNKSIFTNIIALLVVVIAVTVDNHMLYFIGLFALSGAVTNWLAIHMLFEKVPFLYGSGVIPARFEEFKIGIKNMIMEQFFSTENLNRFLKSDDFKQEFNLQPVIENLDFSPTFDSLIDVIKGSSFGAMLDMVGGAAALEPMREPFIAKIQQSIVDTTQTKAFNQLVSEMLQKSTDTDSMRNKVENILNSRLNELTPLIVKNIVQQMIRKHLGWLVVWGGVFGGVIGGITALVGS